METPTQGTMLIVDDEEGMRTLLSALLDTLDIPHLAVDSARAAVATLQANATSINACLLDMNLEDGSGENLYDALRSISPKLIVFPMSGITGEEIKERLGKREIAGVISKPFSASEFSKTVLNGLSNSG